MVKRSKEQPKEQSKVDVVKEPSSDKYETYDEYLAAKEQVNKKKGQ